MDLNGFVEREVERFEIPALVVGTFARGVAGFRGYGEAEKDSRFRTNGLSPRMRGLIARVIRVHTWKTGACLEHCPRQNPGAICYVR